MFEICVSKNVMGILLKAWKKERMKGLMFYGSVSNDSQEQDFAKWRTVPAFAIKPLKMLSTFVVILI